MQRTSISNMAWPADDDREALAIVAANGFAGVELMPFKTFGSWSVPASAIRAYLERLSESGLQVAALQGIAFGVENIHLFASVEHRRRLSDHMERVADIAALLGAGASVFGAPSLRVPGNRSVHEALDIAVETFSGIASIFDARKTVLCFEPIPERYGCRFVNTTEEACDLVRRVGHRAFRAQIDTGSIFINQEPGASVAAALPLAGHLHLSEPDLVPLGTADNDHGSMAAILSGWSGWRSVEMKVSANWRAAIEQACGIVQTIYAREA